MNIEIRSTHIERILNGLTIGNWREVGEQKLGTYSVFK